jgi:competence protein ComGD
VQYLQLLNHKGFTLLESVVVVSIVTIMMFVSFTSIIPLYQANQIHHFFQTLSQDLHYAQQVAITNQEVTKVYLNNSERTYYVSVNNSSLYSRSYPSVISIEKGTATNPVMYLSTGSINQSGTLYVSAYNKRYKVVFLLGKGRYYVEEL